MYCAVMLAPESGTLYILYHMFLLLTFFLFCFILRLKVANTFFCFKKICKKKLKKRRKLLYKEK